LILVPGKVAVHALKTVLPCDCEVHDEVVNVFVDAVEEIAIEELLGANLEYFLVMCPILNSLIRRRALNSCRDPFLHVSKSDTSLNDVQKHLNQWKLSLCTSP